MGGLNPCVLSTGTPVRGQQEITDFASIYLRIAYLRIAGTNRGVHFMLLLSRDPQGDRT